MSTKMLENNGVILKNMAITSRPNTAAAAA